MKMYQPIGFVLLILAAMTSQCLAFTVGRHHSDDKVVSVIQSSLPSYETDLKSNNDSVGIMRIERNTDAPNLDQADTATEEADATATEACRNPSEGELDGILHGITGSSSGTEGNKIEHVFVNTNENNSCPKSLLERNRVPLESRTICPFIMETDTDVERYPQDILFARCACNDCISPYINDFIRNHPGVGCMPTVREMETLRRGQCVNGVYRYEKQTTKVPVACVCARKRVV